MLSIYIEAKKLLVRLIGTLKVVVTQIGGGTPKIIGSHTALSILVSQIPFDTFLEESETSLNFYLCHDKWNKLEQYPSLYFN